MRNRRRYEPVGTFSLTQPKILISDPGYEKDEFCSKVVDNCMTGKWHAFVNRNRYEFVCEGEKIHDRRIAAVFIAHESTDAKKLFSEIHQEERDNGNVCLFRLETRKWENLSDSIGVDSGQAGFFDYQKYGKNSLFKYEGRCGYGDKWYSNCCDATLGEAGVGIIANCGVNASSGFGDGCYSVYGHESHGEIDAMVLFFLADNEEVEVC